MRELKRYKEELALVGLLSLVLVVIRWVSATVWPTTGQYDMAAQTETVFWTILRVVIYALAAWMGLRVVAPKAYQHLKHNVVDRFDTLGETERSAFSLRMFAILFFGLVFLAMSGCTASAATLSPQRACVVTNASLDVGVREASGHNDGPEVERYLASVGLKRGASWCAAFVSYHLSGCGVRNPETGWSPAFSGVSARVWSPRKATRMPMPGDVFTIYYSALGRVGHTGFVTGFDGVYITTVEGNTSAPGSREGDGVYARRRQLSKVYAITNYIQDQAGLVDQPGVLRIGAAGAVRRLPLQAQRDEQHRVAQRDSDHQSATRYAAARAARGGATAVAAACSGTGHAAGDRAERQGRKHCERSAERRAGGLHLRYGEHRSAALGHLDQDHAGHDHHAAGGGGEVSYTAVGLVAADNRDHLHQPAPFDHQPQTLIAA